MLLKQLQCSGTRFISRESMGEGPAEDHVSTMASYTRPPKGCSRHWHVSKMAGWWIHSCRSHREARCHRVLLWRQPRDGRSSPRPGCSFWYRCLLLWDKNQPICSSQCKGTRIVHFRGRGPTLSSQFAERYWEEHRQGVKIGNFWGKRPWVCSPARISRRWWRRRAGVCGPEKLVAGRFGCK